LGDPNNLARKSVVRLNAQQHASLDEHGRRIRQVLFLRLVDSVAWKEDVRSWGTADVFIDGTFQQTVSYGYPSGGDWRVIFSKTGLDPGMHTIEVVCKGGGSINVDAFQYTPAST
jgi:hypothetical protein